MKLIEDIQKKIGAFLLRKELAGVERNKALLNMDDAKTFGIIFEASNKDHVELVKKYAGYLKEMRKKVKVIGYCDAKEIPEFTYSRLEYEFFLKKDLSWYFKPSGMEIDNFIREEFDVLIDLNLEDHFPLQYIAALSRAKCKVGKFSNEKKEIYDLMIEVDPDKSFKYFLRQVDTYLVMINKKEAS